MFFYFLWNKLELEGNLERNDLNRYTSNVCGLTTIIQREIHIYRLFKCLKVINQAETLWVRCSVLPPWQDHLHNKPEDQFQIWNSNAQSLIPEWGGTGDIPTALLLILFLPFLRGLAWTYVASPIHRCESHPCCLPIAVPWPHFRPKMYTMGCVPVLGGQAQGRSLPRVTVPGQEFRDPRGPEYD